MRRPTAGATFLLVALLTLAGCGKKPRPAPEPDPEPTPTPRQSPDVVPQPKDPTPPSSPDVTPTPAPSPIPPFVAYGPNPMPLPVAPMPAVPGAGVAAQPPVPPPVFQPPPPEMKKKDEGDSKSIKPAWPTEIAGRTLPEYLKDTVDLDPAVRERSLRTIPGFGPEIVRAHPGWGKAVLPRMVKDKENDPGVRAAAYEAVGAVGLEKDADIKEAVRILFLAAEQGTNAGTRLHAIQTLSVFGSKADGAINYLIGPPMLDAAYETRRSVAFTLGRISLNDHAGPNQRSLEALFKLASDHSAPVRMEAYQSLAILGPPLAPRPPTAPLLKDLKGEVPRSDEKAVAVYAAMIKKRLAPAPTPKTNESPSPTGVVERDKQVEIMARLVLMRFEPKEVTDENLSGIARYANDKDVGPRLQALNVLGLMGPAASRKIDDVVRALTAEDADVVVAAITTLVQFGPSSKAAIPAVERLRTRGTTEEEKKYWQKLTDDAVKAIRDTEKKDKKP